MRRFIEILWMAIAAFALVEGYISYKNVGFTKDTQVFAVVFAVAAFMYFFRRRQRTRLENKQ